MAIAGNAQELQAKFAAEDEAAKAGKNDILNNESELLQGLLDLGKEKEDPENYRKIQIKRGGKVKIEFRVRPLSRGEMLSCTKEATARKRDKYGEKDVNLVKQSGLLIYTATAEDDREKLWDNPKAQDVFNVREGWEIIEKSLYAGEVSRVLEVITELSGFEEDEYETAKN